MLAPKSLKKAEQGTCAGSTVGHAKMSELKKPKRMSEDGWFRINQTSQSECKAIQSNPVSSLKSHSQISNPSR